MAIKPSLRLAILLVLIHTVAAFTIFATMLPAAMKMALILSILSSLFYYLARDVFLLLPGSWRKISLGQAGVTVVTRGGTDLSGKVAGATTVNPYFIVLNLRLASRYLPVARTIFPDALDADMFRESSVRFRLGQ